MKDQSKAISLILLCIGLFASLALAFCYREIEDKSILAEFHKDCDDKVAAINREISTNLESLHALKALFDSSNHVSSQEFKIASKEFLSRRKAIYALEWIVYSSEEDRPMYEKRRQKEIPGFQFTERGDKGEMIRAAKYPQHFAVYYIEPSKGNEMALGFDNASNPTRLKALHKSKTSSKPIATEGITLVQAKNKIINSIIIFLPVYKKPTVEKKLNGFVVGIFKIDQIILESLINTRKTAICFSLSEDTDNQDKVLYRFNDQPKKAKALNFEYHKNLAPFASRQWSMTFKPIESYFQSRRGITAYLIFSLCFGLTLFACFYLRILLRHSHIIDQKVQEQTSDLIKSKERFQLAMQAASEGIFEWTFGTDNFYFSPGFITMLGYEVDEFPQKISTWKELIHPEDIEETWPQLDKLLANDLSSLKLKYRMRCKNGKYRHIQMSAKIFKRSHIPHQSCLLGTHTDVEEQVKYEEKLLHARHEADKANEAKSEFLANMSHEIRTPMNAILGFSNLLKKRLKDPKDAEFIKAISSSSASLLRLINDILDLSKINAGKVSLEPKPTHTGLLIDDLRQVFAMRIADKDLDFILHVDPQLPKYLYLDGTRLLQILFNLISNAIKFTDIGFIKICVECELKDNMANVSIHIQDSGNGILKEEQNKIFESFEQVNRQSYERYGGTGLGLSISQELAHLMGGEITVESEIGKGSTFSLNLAHIALSHEENAERISDEVKKTHHFKQASILIADDILLNRELLASYLSDSPITCIMAKNGQQAVDLARERSFDLILMDMRMPHLDGLSAAKEIKEFSDVPIILITARAYEERYSDYTDSFLNKPVSEEELLNTVAEFLPEGNIPSPQGTTERETIEISPEMHQCAIDHLKTLQISVDSIKEQMTINEISELIVRVKAILEEYPIESLSEWFHDLEGAFISFDMKRISQLLHNFSKLHE